MKVNDDALEVSEVKRPRASELSTDRHRGPIAISRRSRKSLAPALLLGGFRTCYVRRKLQIFTLEEIWQPSRGHTPCTAYSPL